MVLHLVNLTNASACHPAAGGPVPVGPLRVHVQLSDDVPGKAARFLVSERQVAMSLENGWVRFDVPSVTDHEVVVIS